MLFDKVTEQHILKGIEDFEDKGFPEGFGPSSTYDLIHDGKTFPPKAVMAYANFHAVGRKIERYFKGGLETDCFKAYERNNFKIEPKEKVDFYNWTQTHLELVEYLKDKRSKSKQLLKMLEDTGVVIGKDDFGNGVRGEIEEIDPFTFFCYIHKYGETKRLKILQSLANKLDLFYPNGERGIPTANAQKVWMFPYAFERVGDEFGILWELFNAAIDHTISNELFQRALNIRNVGKTKITEVLFYVRPFDYFPINGPSKPYLKDELGIDFHFENYEEYQQINKTIKEKSELSFPELSYLAWESTNAKNSKTPIQVFQEDETQLKNVLVNFTQTQIDNFFNFLDEIHSVLKIERGDDRFTYNTRQDEKRLAFLIGQRIGWSLDSRTNRGAYEVISNEPFEEVTYSYEGNDGIVMVKFDRIDVLINNKKVVLDQMIRELDGIKKSGFRKNMNTAFEKAVFEQQYRKQFTGSFTEVSEPAATYKKKTMPLNQILYGPPGTGKTFKLQNNYFEHFTKTANAKTKEDYLIEEVESLQWWEVYYIALKDIPNSKVSDLIIHPAIVAKSKLSSIRNIKASAWGCLQRHTVDECDNVNVVGRGNVRAFWKNEDKTWRIADGIDEDAFSELEDILDRFKNYKTNSGDEVKNYEFVTFHQSFTYEDFVEGIKPVLEDENAELRYEMSDGVFKRLANLARNNPEQPYAIFIDEINRGNVASIFGELITLIEKDKRAGAENELSVILPYSKTKFSVPQNLHIIGTMNTADRSIEALDSALRRRFEFKEMLPDYDVIDDVLNYQEFEGYQISNILRTINNRITVLIDRDHQIGHSYFLNLINSSNLGKDLKTVFKYKIIPLLQEYFFNDYVKIAMVIGEGFMDKDQYSNVTFASTDGDYDSDYSDVIKYEIRADEKINISDAIKQLMGHSNDA
ncbi:McrB family protein [Nonlabens sp. YIK11]|uniref:McrB family protein n=1 Tax=Nonlabens sp. YIK11 TaxID=1453349 RepID=UPI0006DD2C72|nr:AAA family ATPase [Nonlabens sp. YIK11]